MGIDRLLDGAAFGDNAVKIMTTAYEETLRELKLDSTRPVTEAVAMKIIECYARGERDPARLRELAVAAVRGDLSEPSSIG
jgi:hypothetical protein